MLSSDWSGSDKHIRFNEVGSVAENGVEEEDKVKEKEDKDTNAKAESNGDVIDDEGNIVKEPKGKGKSEDPEPEVKEKRQKKSMEDALEEAFIQFDATLIDRSVVEQLKKIAGNKDDEAEEEDDEVEKEDEKGEERNEVKELFDEAEMPIEDLVAKYSTSPCAANKKEAKVENGESGSGGSSLPPHMRSLQAADRKKPVSPFLRAKTSPVDLASGKYCQGCLLIGQ